MELRKEKILLLSLKAKATPELLTSRRLVAADIGYINADII